MIGTGAVTAARPRRRRTLGSALLETGAVLLTAARLLWRHWPVLFALFFAGAAIRAFSLIGAVWASKLNDVLGMLILILGPVATLVALVLMLRALLPSLPWLAAAASSSRDDGPGRPKTLMDHLASALVPFLAVYASWGYLNEDVSNYFYEVWADAAFNDPAVFTDPGVIKENLQDRLPWGITTTLVVVVVFAVLLRWVLSTWQGARRWPALGILGAYVEVIWILVTMVALNATRDPVTEWVRDRKVVQWLLDLWQQVTSWLGPFTNAVRGAGEWLAGALASADTVIVVPLAWLAVGAVVYGYRLAEPGPPASELLQRATSRWQALPRPVRVVGTNLTTDVRDRFTPLIHGLRVMFRAGLAPMLFFCLAFLLAQTAREWMWEAERLLIGPQDLQTIWMPVSGALSTVNDGVGVVLLACLLGAAVDRVLRPHPTSP
ncbi:hypothetical protein WEI85_43790 [Actinomycetes bacterium KLBMP 9797]